jgi:hypothetical protein
MPTKKAEVTPAVVLVVVEAFAVSVGGVTVTYRKGEPIHPDDPIVRTHRRALGPLHYPHWSPALPPTVES